MAKYVPSLVDETGEPYAPGTTGIEPLCDEFGRPIAAPTGGDASAANQVLALTALDAIYDALALVGLEATSVQIRDAVTGLGAGSTLADLAAAFSSDALVQADILATLIDGTAKSIIRGGVKGATAAADVTSTSSGANHNAADAILYDTAGAPTFASPFAWSSSTTYSGTSAPVHSMMFLHRPSTLGGSSTAQVAWVGNQSGAVVQGFTAAGGTSDQSNPLPIGGKDPTTNQVRAVLTDNAGRWSVVGPGVSTPATSQSIVYASNSRTANGAPAAITAATSFTATITKLLKLELRYTGAGTRYVWIFDKATNVVTAVDCAAIPIPIANNQGLLNIDFSTVPLNLASGLVVSLSSTETTYTLETSGFYARATWQ